MTYLWLKAFHVAVVITWIGGLLYLALQIATLPKPPESLTDSHTRTIDAARAWDERVTTPAMVLAWMLGIALTAIGGWFPARWLVAKLVLVSLLSGLHGVLSGTLRRIGSSGTADAPEILRHAAPVVLATLAIIAVLVVVKP